MNELPKCLTASLMRAALQGRLHTCKDCRFNTANKRRYPDYCTRYKDRVNAPGWTGKGELWMAGEAHIYCLDFRPRQRNQKTP